MRVSIAMEIHDRLRQARTERGEDFPSISRRSGVPERLLCLIEEGRFEDLPPGIYGRAAIRSYALALGLDSVDVLAACDGLLPAVEDPIGAMGRLRGVRPSKPPQSQAEPQVAAGARCPDWRLAAAAALDASVIGTILLAVIGSATLMVRAPVVALAGSAVAFGLVGLLLGASYFLWLGGLSGATGGERWVGRPSFPGQTRSLNLRGIAIRAVGCAAGDVRFIRELGAWLGSLVASDRASLHTADSTDGPRNAIAGS
jgi:hypothetical protein